MQILPFRSLCLGLNVRASLLLILLFLPTIKVSAGDTYVTEQVVSDVLTFQGTMPDSQTTGLINAVWDEDVSIDLKDDGGNLFGQSGSGTTGFGMTLHTAGSLGMGLRDTIQASTFSLTVPVMVTLEMPVDGIIAPEEPFTISTRWLTPVGAGFTVTGAPTQTWELLLEGDLKFNVDTESCWLGNCQNTEFRLGDLLGYPENDGTIPFNYTLLEAEIAGPSYEDVKLNGVEFELFFLEELDLIPDPLFIDVLSFAYPKLSALTAIGIGTEFTEKKLHMSEYATGPVPRGQSVRDGWYENWFSLQADLTNLVPAAMGLYTGLPIPPMNGTLADLTAIAAAYSDPTGKTAKWLSTASRASFGSLYYNIEEADLTAEFGTNEQYGLYPRPPRIRILEDGVPMTNWFRAGDDIELTMPLSPGAMSLETEVLPSFRRRHAVIAKNAVVNLSVGELRFYVFPKLGPVVDKAVSGSGYEEISVETVESPVDPQTFTQSFQFPASLAEPRSGISGGGGISFGGQKSCWNPDFLPSGATGMFFDDNDGCVMSFWNFVVNGTVNINSYSDTEVSFTLRNSTLKGPGEPYTDLILNPQSDTSIQLQGSVRRSGFDRVDLFFNDDLSTGNRNQIIIDTVMGAFITNSELRGKISNENQSDIVVRNGPLWIHNTEMELDNITIENGELSVQDSTAKLRNLQVLGSATSSMRMTRDTLVTTSSNASTLSSNLEVGNGSLLNVSGSFSNQGAISLETGGWLTVLEGDDPNLPDRLTTPAGLSSEVTIAGDSNLDDSLAALEMVPEGDVDPVALFQSQVEGSRLGTGVLLLNNGLMENQVLNNVGGTVISLGGEIRDSDFALSQGGSILVAHQPLLFLRNQVTGTGLIQVQPGGELLLESLDIGDDVNEPKSLLVRNRGTLKAGGIVNFLENTSLTNEGVFGHQEFFDGDRQIYLESMVQESGLTRIAGYLQSNQAIELAAGEFTGSGLVEADIINRGGVFSAAPVTVNGLYKQLNSGVTEIDFSKVGSPIIDMARGELDGRLNVIVDEAFLTSILPGDSHTILTWFVSRTGEFTSLGLETSLGEAVPNWSYTVVYGADSASIVWEEVTQLDIREFPIFDSGFEY